VISRFTIDHLGGARPPIRMTLAMDSRILQVHLVAKRNFQAFAPTRFYGLPARICHERASSGWICSPEVVSSILRRVDKNSLVRGAVIKGPGGHSCRRPRSYRPHSPQSVGKARIARPVDGRPRMLLLTGKLHIYRTAEATYNPETAWRKLQKVEDFSLGTTGEQKQGTSQRM